MIIMIRRIAIYLIITLASLGFLYAIENKPPLIPHGVYLPATEKSFPKQEGNLLITDTVPSNAQTIGIINIQMRMKNGPSKTEEEQIMKAAQHLASENGADGISLNYFFASGTKDNQTYLLQARAFRT